MKLIAHRGNINGPISNKENRPDYIEEALFNNYDAEIDVWFINNKLFLGHDQPDYKINITWLYSNKEKLWIHCKNIAAIEYMSDAWLFHYFWHENDTMVVTSLRDLWVFPGKQPVRNSIAVMPEIYNDDVSLCRGVCTDYAINYRNKCEKI
jgi:hypothetical protein